MDINKNLKTQRGYCTTCNGMTEFKLYEVDVERNEISYKDEKGHILVSDNHDNGTCEKVQKYLKELNKRCE